MYEEMTYDNIMEAMFARLPDSLDKREGSIIYDATAAVSYQLAAMYFQLGNFTDLVLPDTSAGEYLTRMVEAFGLTRKAATKAVRQGIFDKELPTGTRFSTSGDAVLIFAVSDLISSEDSTFIYELVCETAGKGGNECSGVLLPVEYINGLGRAELGGILTAGTDEEDDESLRERLFAKVQLPSTSGNANDYYNWAMACAGIGAAKVFPLADGPGTVKVVVASEEKTAVEETLIKKVADYIETMRPIGATVTVTSARELTVSVTAKVKLTSETTLAKAQSAFQDLVDTYLQGNAFQAEYISLARIGSLLMDVTGVEDFSDLQLNGTAANITLEDEEIAVCGAVRLEVM